MIPFHAALEQTFAAACAVDELELRLVQLQHIHVEPFADRAGVKQELVRRDSEQRLCHLPHALLVEVLQVLRGHHQGGIPFPHTLQAVADVLNSHRIGQPQVQLVQRRHRVASRQKPVRHIRQHIEQQGVPQALGRRQHAAYTKHQKPVVGDVGVSVEERRVRTYAQGVQPQQHLLQQLPCIQAAFPVIHQLVVDERVQVGQDGVVLRLELAEVCSLRDAPLAVQLGQHDLNGIQLRVGEFLVGAEEVLQEGDVPRQQCGLAEGLRRRLIRLRVLIPAPHLQYIDALLTGHQVDKAAVQITAQLLQLMLRVQRDHGLTSLQQVADEQLHEITFALSAVSEDKDIGGGLIAVAAVKIHHDIAAVFVLADVEAVGICFAGVVERVQVGHTAGGQHTLKLTAKSVIAHRTDTVKVLLLPQEQLVHVQLAAHQFCQHIRLKLPQMLHAVRRHFQIHGAVEQRLMLTVHLMHQLRHIPQVALGLHCLPQLVGI